LVAASQPAEIAEKQARSIKYQLTIAKLPLAKDIDDFDFADTPVNEALIRDLASGAFLTEQRNVVLVGGTGTGKSHLAIAIARACIRGGARGRFYTVVDLVNRVETEARAGRQGRLADYPMAHIDLVLARHEPRRGGGQFHVQPKAIAPSNRCSLLPRGLSKVVDPAHRPQAPLQDNRLGQHFHDKSMFNEWPFNDPWLYLRQLPIRFIYDSLTAARRDRPAAGIRRIL
jgi:hypothetical protein